MATKKKAAAAKKPAAKKKPAAAKKAAPAKKLSTKDTIKANNKALIARLAAGDTAGIAKLYTSKAMLLPQGVPGMKGAKNIAGYWAGAVAQGVAGGALKTAEVDELGSTAIESGTYQLKTADGAVCGAGKYVVVWKKEGGVWKLHRDIFNSDS